MVIEKLVFFLNHFQHQVALIHRPLQPGHNCDSMKIFVFSIFISDVKKPHLTF